MPALLEFQRAMRHAIAATDGAVPEALRAWIGAGEESQWRLAIYRDTSRATLGNALALSFPAVQRLVGAEFFAGAAQGFIDTQLPQGSCLNDYGAGFAAWLAGFIAQHAPAAPLAYLPDVARLEWAVNRALHAPDRAALALERLAVLDEKAMAGLRFVPHPSVSVLSLEYPADLIWRAVLEQDDAGMAAVDLRSGPVSLLVERFDGTVRVQRLAPSTARFTQRLFAGEPLHAVLEPDIAEPHHAELADHLGCGRMVDFQLQAL